MGLHRFGAWRPAVGFWICVALVSIGVVSGLSVLVLFALPGLFFVEDDKGMAECACALRKISASMKWVRGIGGMVAGAGTILLALKPRGVETYMTMARIITTLCWIIYWTVTIWGMVSHSQAVEVVRAPSVGESLRNQPYPNSRERPSPGGGADVS